MGELIKGIPLEPEEKDAAMDKVDELFKQSRLWMTGAVGCVTAAAARYALEPSSRDTPLFWCAYYAFTIGHMAGVHKERARRRKKVER